MKCVLIVITAVTFVTAADLTIEPDVENFIQSLNAENKLSYANQSKVMAFSEVVRPDGGYSNVGYQAIRQQKDEKTLNRLRFLVADGQGAAGMVRYDAMNGRYLFRKSYSVMRYTSESVPDELAVKAQNDLNRLLGSEAEQFVLANTETDWQENGAHSDKRMLAYSFRFTRQINGRHIVDNTAYIRIIYSGNDKMYGFDIVNPVLIPVRIPAVVRLDATRKRLEHFAVQKKTAWNNDDGDVRVKRITAKKGIPSYRAKKKGDKIILAPYISFFCRYDMENGDTFSRFEDFSLDASR